jgi:hypothetical protein
MCCWRLRVCWFELSSIFKLCHRDSSNWSNDREGILDNVRYRRGSFPKAVMKHLCHAADSEVQQAAVGLSLPYERSLITGG